MGEETDTRVRTWSRAAPSDRSATVTAGWGSSNFPKKDRNASISFRCDSGLIFASDDVEAGKGSCRCPRWARLTVTVIGGGDWVFNETEISIIRATKLGGLSTVHVYLEQKTVAKQDTERSVQLISGKHRR